MSNTAKIIYTKTDEAPLLATYSFLPVISAFASTAGVDVETRDISLAARIASQFPERLTEDQHTEDDLAELGELAQQPEANIIKLPNISASLPQLKEAIKELQKRGLDLPDYPEEPQTDEEKEARAAYDRVKGSAVNPVLREGNSDRRAPQSVKGYVKKYPHPMGEWSSDSRTEVATMGHDDFRSNEASVVIESADTLSVVLTAEDGTETVLKDDIEVEVGEVVDATFMSVGSLRRFLAEQVARAKADDILFSIHLKSTMMKVSDPIIFGHAVMASTSPTLFEPLRRRARLGGRQRLAERRPRGSMHDSALRRALPDETSAGHPGGHRRRAYDEWPGGSPWSIRPSRASPTCTCPVRRDHRRLDAGR